MLIRRIDIGEYDMDVLRLLERRLNQTSHEYTIMPAHNGMEVELEDPGGLEAFCTALTLLLVRDLSKFELAQMVDRLPISLVEKQEVLTNAIHCARRVERPASVRRKLLQYLGDEDEIHLSGYMRFRMSETIRTWKICIQGALEELQLEKQYLELMGVLRAFVEVKPARVREVSLLLHPDGSCTLTDDSDMRVNYAECDPDRLVSVLVELAPERLTIYDLGEGHCAGLVEMLQSVFAGRVRFL